MFIDVDVEIYKYYVANRERERESSHFQVDLCFLHECLLFIIANVYYLLRIFYI